MSYNKCIIQGNLGHDPELRMTQGGQAVANFSVATSEKFKRNEQWEEKTEWHSIVVWGKQAENCSKYLKKGKGVLLEGKIQTRTWEKDGTKHYKTEIIADRVMFIDRRDANDTNTETAQTFLANQVIQPCFDEDVPF